MTTITSETYRISTSNVDLLTDTPCFVVDDLKLHKNVEMFRQAFREFFGANAVVSYSFKTNPHKKILREIRSRRDVLAEIVSSDELHLAQSIGFEPNEIIYNGVIHDLSGKFCVAANRGIVNVENLRELSQLSQLAAACKTKINVGIRISYRPNNLRSRFGFEYGCEDYVKAFAIARENPYFDIVGIHCHGHGGRYLNDWQKRVEYLAPIAKEICAEYIDFGSNMFGPMDRRLECQFEGHVPTPYEYARTIHDGLRATYSDTKLPKVIIEPGTPIISNVVSLVGHIYDIRQHYGKTVIQTDCSIYNCGYFHGSDKMLPIDVIHMSEGKAVSDAQVYGYTCAESDIIAESFTGTVAVGDFIAIRNVGAYGYSLSSNFIRKCPKTHIISGFSD